MNTREKLEETCEVLNETKTTYGAVDETLHHLLKLLNKMKDVGEGQTDYLYDDFFIRVTNKSIVINDMTDVDSRPLLTLSLS